MRKKSKVFNRWTKDGEKREECKFGGGSKNLKAHFFYSNDGS